MLIELKKFGLKMLGREKLVVHISLSLYHKYNSLVHASYRNWVVFFSYVCGPAKLYPDIIFFCAGAHVKWGG